MGSLSGYTSTSYIRTLSSVNKFQAIDELARLSYTAITAGAWQLLFLLASGYDMSTLARTATGNLSAPKTLWETLGTQSGAADWKNETVYGAIHQYRLMTKLESTYLQALSEKYLDWKDGRVHAQFKMMSTRTARRCVIVSVSNTSPSLRIARTCQVVPVTWQDTWW